VRAERGAARLYAAPLLLLSLAQDDDDDEENRGAGGGAQAGSAVEPTRPRASPRLLGRPDPYAVRG
jgi:hypothetical protein